MKKAPSFINTEDEIGELHEEDNIFMKQKELIKIENDKSINVDVSYDDEHSKSSTLRKNNNNNDLLKYMKDSNDFGIILPTDLKNQNFYNNENNENNNNNNENRDNLLNSFNCKNNNNNDNDINNYVNENNYIITNFSYIIIGNNSINQSYPSFGLSQSKEMKALENKYLELMNNYNTILSLMEYWQKFYLEIVQLVSSQLKNNSNLKLDDLLNEQFKLTVIEDVKNLINISQQYNFNNYNNKNKTFQNENITIIKENNLFINKSYKFYNNLENINENYFNIIQNNNIFSNKFNKKLLESKNENFNFDKNFNLDSLNFEQKNIINNKFYLEDDELDDLPPIIFNKENKAINLKLQKIQNLLIKPNKKNNKKINLSFSDNKIVNSYFEITNSYNIKKCKTNYHPLNEKETMTDLTIKNIYNLETLNNEISNQLNIIEKDKQKLKLSYEQQINDLNNEINLLKLNNVNNNTQDTKDILSTTILNKSTSNINLNVSINQFLPEMIPPEQTYKIFSHCIKHFKYEEEIYKEFMEEEDLIHLKNFVKKMEKFFKFTSMPVKINNIEPIHYYRPIESATQKKYKETLLNGFKPLTVTHFSRSSSKKRNDLNDFKNNSTYLSNNNKNNNNNNSTFNKYKAVLRSLKLNQ